jgi:hypothetical protein
MLTGNIRDVATVFKTSYFEDAKINSNVNFPFPNNNGNSAGKREDTFEDINTPELETSDVDFPDFHL